jgi:hypothetical protein
VEKSIAEYDGPWLFHFGALPGFVPPGFQGQLEQLRELPKRVSLRSAQWFERCTEAMTENPWIERVVELKREGGAVRFSAQLAQPIVALRLAAGFALVDRRGTVIDVQPGFELAPEWGIPFYCPLRAPAQLAPGESLEDEEYRELVQLTVCLLDGKAMDRWNDRIPEIAARCLADGSLLWYLRCSNGMEIEWGRAPNAVKPCALPTATKLRSLSEAMAAWDRLQGVDLVTLSQEPRALIKRRL